MCGCMIFTSHYNYTQIQLFAFPYIFFLVSCCLPHAQAEIRSEKLCAYNQSRELFKIHHIHMGHLLSLLLSTCATAANAYIIY